MSESSELSIEDFYRYFAKWQSAYPSGIPEEFIELPGGPTVVSSEVSPEASASKPRAVFYANSSEVGSDEQGLFSAAVQKGLGWQLEECELVLVESDLSASAVGDLVGAVGTGVESIVLLGHLPQILVQRIDDLVEREGVVVKSESLKDVVSDKLAKRRFWEDLKRIRSN